VASETNQHRFKEMSIIDPSYPDVIIASPDNNIRTVVAKVVSSISSGNFVYKWRQNKQGRQCTYNVALLPWKSSKYYTFLRTRAVG
jgi:hypothetical protein